MYKKPHFLASMIVHQTQVRVRYADTDRMGYVYYGKYAEYFEVGRTELIRSLGFAYKKMEEEGVMLPVAECNLKYHKAAKYDDLLTVKTSVPEFPNVRLITDYEIYNEAGEKLTAGRVVLVFVDMQTGKPTRMPEHIRQAFEQAWQP